MRRPPGLTFLDHTADVGIAVTAPTLASLFHRAGLGMLALLRGEEEHEAAAGEEAPEDPTDAPADGPDWTTVEAEASEPAWLLAAWLRELLFLHETEHRDYAAARFERLEETALRARVRTEPAAGAVREIKGVTYHELVVERAAVGWSGQVIFDV